MASLPFCVRDSHADPSAAEKTRGTRVIVIGEPPEPMAGRCDLQISMCNPAAQAGLICSREKVLQALLLNAMANDIEQAEEIPTAWLRVHADHVPQFM